ncbi:ABC transporter substrate-binding protein [Cobetia sp. L2A1]|uniref:ABC transporter substrate-binding protein n=1 Tax=Cobetia sp. L2A1 TaxID=2686360 RepID=UPI00131BFDC5|nr:ABC transporter substrate-binding protein [Cobetia sp. L2A1]
MNKPHMETGVSPCSPVASFRRLVLGMACLLISLGAALPVLAASAVTAIDDSGKRITLPYAAQRVVTLAPHAVELVAAAGGLSSLVGVSQGSDYPLSIAQLPRVASYQGPDLEAVLAAKPSLIVAWGSGLSAEMRARLSALGLVVFISEPRTLADVLSNITRLGQLMGTQAEADKRVAALATRIDQLEGHSRAAGGEPLPVFFMLGDSPMTTLAGGHLVNELIRRCGGEPLLADAPTLVPQIRREALWLAQPHLILHPVVAGAPRQRWEEEWRARSGSLASVALAGLDPDLISRPGPRSIEAMAEVCAAIAKVRADSR